MATISPQDFLNKQASNTSPSQKTPSKASDTLYTFALENKSTITKIALGIIGAIAVAATVFYNYDKLSEMDIWTVKGTEPLPKPNIKLDKQGTKTHNLDIKVNQPVIHINEIVLRNGELPLNPILNYVPPIMERASLNNTPTITVESLYQPGLANKNADTNVSEISFKPQEKLTHSEQKNMEMEELFVEMETPKPDESSEILMEEETNFAAPVSIDEEKGAADSFNDEHYRYLAYGGITVWVVTVGYLYWKVFKDYTERKNDLLLESINSKNGIELSTKITKEPEDSNETKEESEPGLESGHGSKSVEETGKEEETGLSGQPFTGTKPQIETGEELKENSDVEVTEPIGPQSSAEKKEPENNSSNLYKEDRQLINGFEIEYFNSLLGRLEQELNKTSDELLDAPGDIFVDTITEMQKPISWIKIYLKDVHTKDRDVVKFIKQHQNEVNEHVRKSLIEHAVLLGMPEDEASEFANDVMESQPISLDELREKLISSNSILVLK